MLPLWLIYPKAALDKIPLETLLLYRFFSAPLRLLTAFTKRLQLP